MSIFRSFRLSENTGYDFTTGREKAGKNKPCLMSGDVGRHGFNTLFSVWSTVWNDGGRRDFKLFLGSNVKKFPEGICPVFFWCGFFSLFPDYAVYYMLYCAYFLPTAGKGGVMVCGLYEIYGLFCGIVRVPVYKKNPGSKREIYFPDF